MDIKKPNVMLIADGSRRWARKNRYTLKEGYQISAALLAELFGHLNGKVEELFIPVCTMNNLQKRPQEQIPWYLDCFIDAINNASVNINLVVVGDLTALPGDYSNIFMSLTSRHCHPQGLSITYLVGWSSDYEVLNLCKNSNSNPPKDLAELKSRSVISKDIDLIIRCGKVKRLSAMIPLFSPYAELYFIDELFPDVTEAMIDDAIKDYYGRERRFGSG